MKYYRAIAIILGSITAAALVIPFALPSAGEGLASALFGWLIVAPVGAFLTVLFTLFASVAQVNNPLTSRKVAGVVCGLWTLCLVIVAAAAIILFQMPGRVPLLAEGVGVFAITLLLATVTVFGYAMTTRRMDRTELAEDPAARAAAAPRRRRRTKTIVAVSVVALVLAGGAVWGAAQLRLAESYRTTVEAIDYWTPKEFALNSENEAKLAVACLGHPDALAELDRFETVATASPIALPSELTENLAAGIDPARAGLAAMDTTACEEVAAEVAAELSANDVDPAAIPWRSADPIAQLTELRAQPEPRPYAQVADFLVTGSQAKQAARQLADTRHGFVTARDNGPASDALAAPVVTALGLVSEELRAAAIDGSEAVIMQAGMDGTEAAEELRALAAAAQDQSAGSVQANGALADYVVAANAMLGV
ncbi:hypothetical protein EDF62_1271 [Leucobacter luti]|uniref:Uncharacterized protein n=2 Tax=Leucobacter luti TaxID=340320 RepID=A0A4R6S184_9MICO|nr:hypothetical protein [Leucobacter luti]TDP93292.1 hypothetical protein EDF62_1271 [Leucobacter luti]